MMVTLLVLTESIIIYQLTVHKMIANTYMVFPTIHKEVINQTEYKEIKPVGKVLLLFMKPMRMEVIGIWLLIGINLLATL